MWHRIRLQLLGMFWGWVRWKCHWCYAESRTPVPIYYQRKVGGLCDACLRLRELDPATDWRQIFRDVRRAEDPRS